MAAKTEGLTVGDIVKEERSQRGSRQNMLVDASQTIVRGAVCRSGATGRKVVIGALVNDVQTIGITGAPTGSVVLEFTNEAGARVTTDPIAADGILSVWQTGVDTALGANAVTLSGTAVTAMVATFDGVAYAGKLQPLIGVDISSATSAEDVTVTHTTKGGGGSGSGADEVQTLAMIGTISGGTYTISITDESGDVQTTTALAYDANLAAINAALDVALGATEVVATGTIRTACVFTFSGSNYEKRNQVPIVIDMTLLTGGGTTYTMTETTKGGSEGTPEADSIALEAVTTAGGVLTTKALFLTNHAIVLTDNLDFGDGNKVYAILQLEKVGIIARSAAPEDPSAQP